MTTKTLKDFLKKQEHSGNTTLPPIDSMKEHGATKEEIELAKKVHQKALQKRATER